MVNYQKIVSFLLPCCLTVFVSSCSRDEDFKKKLSDALHENPDLIAIALEANPEETVRVMQGLVATARANAEKSKEEEVQNYLKNPLQPRSLENDIVKGDKNAKITIYRYVDFLCRFCSKGHDTMERIFSRYSNDVNFVIRHYPSMKRQGSLEAAKYFEAIKRQSPEAAYQYAEQIYKNVSYKKVARRLNIDQRQLKRDLKDRSIEQKIIADMQEAKDFGFKGTPGYIVGGVPVRGAYPEETFVRLIEEWERFSRSDAREQANIAW